jgi:uncharacterized protein
MSRIANRPPDGGFRLAVDQWTAPFWEAAAEGRLVAARCPACGHVRMPPTPFCPECLSQGIDWIALPGTGSIYSYTIVERATLPGTEAHIPYVPAVVALDGAEGIRLITNIVESPIDAIRVGAPVTVIYDRAGDAVVPRFRLNAGDRSA